VEGGRPRSRDGTLLCPAQLPGAPEPLVTHDLIGINSFIVDMAPLWFAQVGRSARKAKVRVQDSEWRYPHQHHACTTAPHLVNIVAVIRSYVMAHTPARHDVPLAAEAQLMASVRQQRRLLQAPPLARRNRRTTCSRNVVMFSSFTRESFIIYFYTIDISRSGCCVMRRCHSSPPRDVAVSP
jgi:hypothetical protein